MTHHKISASTLARTAALALALTNQVLSAVGKPMLPWPHGGTTTASPLRPSRLTTS